MEPTSHTPDEGHADDVVELALGGVELGSEYAVPPSAEVTLVELGGTRELHIVMARHDGKAITDAVAGIIPPRPTSRDLFMRATEALGARVVAATITERRDGGIYTAEVKLRAQDGTMTALDARPSDALNLALRSPSAPLYARAAVMPGGPPPSDN